jgi:Peptidase family M23
VGRASAVSIAPLLLVLIAIIVAIACAPASRASVVPDARSADERLPDDPQARSLTVDPLRCTDRASIPAVDNAFEAAWSPDSSALAISRIVTIPNARTVTGYEEDQRLVLLNIATGAVRELGQGSEPTWSGSGAYLAYWKDDGFLYVRLGNTTAAIIPASEPDVRWVGDDLYYWSDDEIRVWSGGIVQTVARVSSDLTPHYPRDDAYFSADAQQFTITRYSQDGTTERYIGTTATGEVAPLQDEGATFIQWAPAGHTLLLRTPSALSLRAADGSERSASLASLPGPVHGWTADGRLLLGTLTPTVPAGNAFDPFTVWDGAAEKTVATLPNLMGIREFSPDGTYFAGVARTGLYSTQLEVYRCDVAEGEGLDLRADTAARSRQARIDSDPRRFVRPTTGAITQFLQGSHTGIDVAAPYGSLIFAADDGVVDAIGWVPVGGRRVCVMHAGGLESCDYHTSLPLVSIGDHVVRGQPVALIGMTGLTTGPHVHWETKLNGMVVDPLQR